MFFSHKNSAGTVFSVSFSKNSASRTGPICAEGFSALLNDTEARGRIQGVSICVGAPSITHLLFADDSLLLLKANEENAAHLRHVLQIYETCSGQKINKEKSSIVFSKNTTAQVDRNLCKLWSSHRNLGMKNI